MFRGKTYRDVVKKMEVGKLYEPLEAMNLAKELARAKFVETVEVAIRLGVDPRHSDQVVRGAVVLPHGTGKVSRVAVFAKGDKTKGRGSSLKKKPRLGGAFSSKFRPQSLFAPQSD